MQAENQIIINNKLTIPLSELQFRFTTSSGPGGQHVNKAETRVILSFDVANSPALDDPTRQRLLHKLANRLDKEGMLQLQVQESRSQHRNREIAIRRFQALLAAALLRRKKRKRTRPSQAAVERRLKAKRQQSEKKQSRRRRWDK